MLGVMQRVISTLTDDNDNAYDADRTKWKATRASPVVNSFTCYSDSGITRHMCGTHGSMYEYRPLKSMNVRTGSYQLRPILGLGQLFFAVMQELPTALLLDEMLHVALFRGY